MERSRPTAAARPNPSGRAKTREAHELPLSAPAMAVLEARKPAAKGELVFPSADGRPYTGSDHLLTRIRERIGHADTKRAERFNFHDVRRSFVSHLAERGYDVDLLDQCLATRERACSGSTSGPAGWPSAAGRSRLGASLVAGGGESQSGNVVAFEHDNRVLSHTIKM